MTLEHGPPVLAIIVCLLSQALPLSSYYVAGDFNFWDFQPMEEVPVPWLHNH